MLSCRVAHISFVSLSSSDTLPIVRPCPLRNVCGAAACGTSPSTARCGTGAEEERNWKKRVLPLVLHRCVERVVPAWHRACSTRAHTAATHTVPCVSVRRVLKQQRADAVAAQATFLRPSCSRSDEHAASAAESAARIRLCSIAGVAVAAPRRAVLPRASRRRQQLHGHCSSSACRCAERGYCCLVSRSAEQGSLHGRDSSVCGMN
jgi:hypothetical protein